MSLQNLESVGLMVSEKHCLHMADGQTDMAKSIFLVALIKNIHTLQDLKCLFRPITYILPFSRKKVLFRSYLKLTSFC